MQKFKLVGDTPLRYNGKTFVENDEVKAEPKEVAHLIESGRLVDPDGEAVVVLLSSQKLPEEIPLGDDLAISQEALIAFLQEKSPLPPEEWNKLTDEQREEALNGAVQFLSAVHDATKANKGKKPAIKAVQALMTEQHEISGQDIDDVLTLLQSLKEPPQE